MKRLALVWFALSLAGCEFEIPGQKAKDAVAMGYACRVSIKSPEQCMRENPKYPPVSLLEGWHEADKDVKDKKVETNFPPPPPVVIPVDPPPQPKKKEGEEGEAKPEGEQAAEGAKAAEPEKKPEADAKSAEGKDAKAKPEPAKTEPAKAEAAKPAGGH